MSDSAIEQLFESALSYQEQGQYIEAQSLYQQVLEKNHAHIEALNNLGAITFNQGDLLQAEKWFARILELNENDINANYNLGSVKASQREFDAAVVYFRRATELYSTDANLWHTLAMTLKFAGRLDEAAPAFQNAVQFAPDSLDYYVDLGTTLHSLGRFPEALSCFANAEPLNPYDIRIHHYIGMILSGMGKHQEAIECYQRVVQIDPRQFYAWNNMGNVYQAMARHNDAMNCYKRAIELNPNYAEAHNNLAGTLTFFGRHEESLQNYRKAIALMPDYLEAYSNLLMTMNYVAGYEPRTIYEEHCRLSEILFAKTPRVSNFETVDKNPDRKLRIGYVSPDFRFHSVAYFALPLIESHNREKFHITCYNVNSKFQPDQITQRFQKNVDQWRNVMGVKSQRIAEMIREDEIDILIDLAGHSGHNQLSIFAFKPAPVQITYLGYPNTTGMSQIDYRFVDAITDPPGMTEQFNTEKLFRLDNTSWCYSPLIETPPVSPLPLSQNGYVTFGNFNNYAKFNRIMFEAWAKLLSEIPSARLVLKNSAMNNPVVRDEIRAFFRERQISDERVQILSPDAALFNHLERYHQIDIALDTFPYHGTTTTCEAMWMGVPVVTLAGSSHVSRVGKSLLSTVGLAELAANSVDEYVRIARDLSEDVSRLTKLRGELREKIQGSPLMNAEKFTNNIETAYREMWSLWCKQGV